MHKASQPAYGKPRPPPYPPWATAAEAANAKATVLAKPASPPPVVDAAKAAGFQLQRQLEVLLAPPYKASFKPPSFKPPPFQAAFTPPGTAQEIAVGLAKRCAVICREEADNARAHAHVAEDAAVRAELAAFRAESALDVILGGGCFASSSSDQVVVVDPAVGTLL